MSVCARTGLHLLLGCAAVGILSGCYNVEEVQNFLLEPRAPISGTEYRVLPPDVLRITSLHVPEIGDVQQTVRPDGVINLPLLGEMKVVDRTPAEIEAMITKAAKEYYAQVDATVEVLGYKSQFFYVFGQVLRPGPFPWTGHDTVLDALAKTQPNDLAWPERIIVVRPLDPQEGGWEPVASDKYKKQGVRPESKERPYKRMTINVYAMIKSGDMSNNVILKPNDVIFVQPNPLAEVGLAVQSLLFPIRGASSTVYAPVQATQGY